VLDAFPPAEQPQARLSLAGALRLVVSQRLVPSADKTRVHAAAEVLPGSLALNALIRDGKVSQIPTLQERGRRQGAVRLDDALADLVRAGKVDAASARSYADAPDELDARIGRKPSAPPATQGTPGMLPKKNRPQEEQPMDLGGLLSKAGSLFGSKKG
jgi:twitching motility protein PilT